MESDRGEAFGTFAGVDGYLGIRFYIGANLHYGWIHVNSDLGFPKQAAGFITEWAYNSSPNQPIAAGVVPEPSVAALLIIGGGSVLLFRRFKT